SPTPKVDAGASTRSTVIRLRLPQRKSTRLTPPAPVLTVDKADKLILQDTLQVYELKRREKGKNVEESRITPFPTPIRSPRIHTDLVSLDIEKLQELTVPHTTASSSSPSNKAKFMPRKSFVTLADHLHEAMAGSLPIMADKHIKEQVEKQVPEQDDPYNDAHPEGEKSTKWQKTSEYETYVSGESSSGQDNEQEQGPSTSG
nr:hypothetical protein [Tanacetum cinerariifolium]